MSDGTVDLPVEDEESLRHLADYEKAWFDIGAQWSRAIEEFERLLQADSPYLSSSSHEKGKPRHASEPTHATFEDATVSDPSGEEDTDDLDFNHAPATQKAANPAPMCWWCSSVIGPNDQVASDERELLHATCVAQRDSWYPPLRFPVTNE